MSIKSAKIYNKVKLLRITFIKINTRSFIFFLRVILKYGLFFLGDYQSVFLILLRALQNKQKPSNMTSQ